MVKDTYKKKVSLFCQTPKKVQEAELSSVVERGVILKTELWDFWIDLEAKVGGKWIRQLESDFDISSVPLPSISPTTLIFPSVEWR